MPRNVTIGAACLEVSHDKNSNLERIEGCISEASRRGINLLVLPEIAVQGYPLGLGSPWAGEVDQYEYQLRNAETVPGPVTEHLTQLAAKHEIELVVGLTELPTEPGSAGRLFNTSVLIGGSGLKARYRKVHLGATEKCLWNRGQDWVVADTAAGKAGLLICYDLCFPETARCLALAGAQLLLMPTAWPPMPTEGYDLFTRARALENQVYLVSANLVGGPRPGFWGHSRIVNPRGEVIAETEGSGIAAVNVDVDEGIIDARTHGWFGQVFLRDREPGLYRQVTFSA
jgi:predicted amidohydrolase